MKKTLRLIALAGVIASSWLLTEEPSQALMDCMQVGGSSCSTTTYVRCWNSNAGEPQMCRCIDYKWNCMYEEW
jgi:hypothetical protein